MTNTFFLDIKYILSISVVVLVVGLLAYIFLYNKDEKADTDLLIATLQEASELTTAKLNYTGIFQEFLDLIT